MNKKLIGIVVSSLSLTVVVVGVVLYATQIRSHGMDFFLSWLFYALAIMCGGMFVTWLPRLRNSGWSLTIVGGRLRFKKRDGEIDIHRTRLIFWPLITLFLELYGLVYYWTDAHSASAGSVAEYVFGGLGIVLLFAWVIIISVQERSSWQKNDRNL